jgi:hypothetical protein
MSDSVWLVQGIGVLFATHEAETAAECAERGLTVTPYRRFVERSTVAPVAQPSGDTGELDAQTVEDERWLEAMIREQDDEATFFRANGPTSDSELEARHRGRAEALRRILARLRGSPVPAVEEETSE